MAYTIAPELITALDIPNMVICSNIPEIPALDFTDNCSDDITVTFNETSTFNGDDQDYQLIWEWIATDSCNNSSVITETINVISENFITKLYYERCNGDGSINLYDYLDNSADTTGLWEVISGDTTLDEGLFDPLEVELGDYVFGYTTSNQGCLETIELTITVNDDCIALPCGSESFKISKAITPNGDPYNEFFTVTGTKECGFIIEVKLFNRYGALIYESNDYQNDWNGFTPDKSLGNSGKIPNGTYYYIVVVKDSGLEPFAGPIYVGTK